ncbi:hypothetical protein B0H14DRAFT_2930121 [Mycena olivaceomarginata]|nr:hypothetical protein B0H14DRAFT_2930121 [Mycena olivaceomarginata]
MATRSTTPSSNLAVLAPTNSLKRALQRTRRNAGRRRRKTPVVVPLELPANAPSAPPTPTALRGVMVRATHSCRPVFELFQDSGKGKRKAALQSLLRLPSAAAARPPVPAEDEDQSATIARLNVQLKFQSMLLKKHETTLTQFNQSLTCQVCLDLLHKPYALAPCGHIACYNCLVAWFTAVPDEPHHYAPRRKTCPNCRATIRERPVEVWNIKDLVAALLKSGLLPGLFPAPPAPPALPGPPQPAGAQPDPWHNIFRYPHQHPMFQPPPPGAHAEFGVETWACWTRRTACTAASTACTRSGTACARAASAPGTGAGRCSARRATAGGGALDPLFWPHFLPVGAIPALIGGGAPGGPQWWGGAGDSEDDDDDDEDDAALERAIREAEEEDGYDSFIDDEDEDDGAPLAAAIVEIEDDSEEDADGEGRSSPPVGGHTRRAAPARVVISSDEDEDEEGDAPSRAPYVPSLRRADEPGPPASRRQPAPPSRRRLSC